VNYWGFSAAQRENSSLDLLGSNLTEGSTEAVDCEEGWGVRGEADPVFSEEVAVFLLIGFVDSPRTLPIY
jgi:hypothetical protein